MPRGGKREGAGRKAGSKNETTILRETIEQLAAKKKWKLPLVYMVEVLNDEKTDDARKDAMARYAAPFIHPRRVAVHSTNDSQTKTHEQWLREMGEDIVDFDEEDDEVIDVVETQIDAVVAPS